ncbi:MAG: hypothetical protein IJJ33_04310 [Victivallales bacterium]|nr:hypothetical protein [Victivallales bacterium]
MLTIVLSLIGGGLAGFGLNMAWHGHPVWCSLAGVLVAVLIMTIINLLMRKKLEAVFLKIQEHIVNSQNTIRRKIATLGSHAGPGFQARLEQEQAQAIREAIDMIDGVKPFEKWNFMVGRQADTLRAQFYFQIKDFESADKYFRHALLLDPMLLAMQMTRCYKRGELKEVENLFQKGQARFKDDKAVLVYALYSWILVQQNRIEDAIQVLVKAKTRAENDVLKQNWDHLVNGRVKRFSNAGLGDQWFALYLEQPRVQRIRETPGRGFRRF